MTTKVSPSLGLKIRQSVHWRVSQKLSTNDMEKIITAVADYLEEDCARQVPDFTLQSDTVRKLRMQAKIAKNGVF